MLCHKELKEIKKIHRKSFCQQQQQKKNFSNNNIYLLVYQKGIKEEYIILF